MILISPCSFLCSLTVEYEAVNYLVRPILIPARLWSPIRLQRLTLFAVFSALQTVHFRLINSLARSCADHREPIESDTSAWRFHAQLFESGFDKSVFPVSITRPKVAH